MKEVSMLELLRDEDNCVSKLNHILECRDKIEQKLTMPFTDIHSDYNVTENGVFYTGENYQEIRRDDPDSVQEALYVASLSNEYHELEAEYESVVANLKIIRNAIKERMEKYIG